MSKSLKYLIIGFASLLVIILTFTLFFNQNKKEVNNDYYLSKTLDLSREYISLRYRTDNVFTNIVSFDYKSWSTEVDLLIDEWNAFEIKTNKFSEETNKLSYQESSIIKKAFAYSEYSVTEVFDSAPAGKKIATLAKHLNTDAKNAMAILRQEQDLIQAEAWSEEGDLYRKAEVTATVIKDTSKVVGFVGGIALTGGCSAIATGGLLTKATVIVGGADLVLEVTEDGSKIALGDNNKIASIVSDVRIVTEPVATILSINEIPENMATGYQKFQSVMVGLEQFKGAAQDGKIIGITLPSYSADKEKGGSDIDVAILDLKDVNDWSMKEFGLSDDYLKKVNIKDLVGVGGSELNNQVVEKEEVSEVDGKKITLIMKEPQDTNDWQAKIKNKLFYNAAIDLSQGNFTSEYKDSFSEGNFIGVASIKLSGEFDSSTDEIKGTHYRVYEGTYKGEPRTLIYSGNFKQKLDTSASTTKINYNGKIEETRTDGKGKPYTTTSEGGVSILYDLIIK